MKQIVINRVLEWYQENGRSFPWRKDKRSPYEILVAEILLQKTRAETVEKVYESFLDHLPSLEVLNSSDFEEIESHLSGLGLQNRRAKWLKEIAEKLINENDGKIPQSEEKIKKLPGVGLYIGNAVLTFAFSKKKPILDANTSRVLGRMHSINYKGDLRRKKRLKKKAKEILPDEHIKKFNWALLDIGAILCHRNNPECSKCPFSKECNFKGA